MKDDFEICDLDIDFEPQWLKRMNPVGRITCYVPAVIFGVLFLAFIVLCDKIKRGY